MENQGEKILIRSVWAKRTFYAIYLWSIPAELLVGLGFGWWNSSMVQNSGIEVPAEMPVQAFWSSLFFFIICIAAPLTALSWWMNYRRYRKNEMVITEERLQCRYGRKKSLDIPLSQAKEFKLTAFKGISFRYAGKKRTVYFLENREEIQAVFKAQKMKNGAQ